MCLGERIPLVYLLCSINDAVGVLWRRLNLRHCLCLDQVRCSDPVLLYDPCNFDDSFASEYGGYTTAELR